MFSLHEKLFGLPFVLFWQKESAKASPRRSAEDPYQRQQFTVQQYRETLQQTQQTYYLERRCWL